MTTWTPDLARHGGPRYRAIADALAADIARGTLAPGDQLPTHRDLAWRLGVTIGTITRAYAEAERRGLTAGEVGRGTFVRRQHGPAPAAAVPDPIDFGINAPTAGGEAAAFAAALQAIAGSPALSALAGYQTPGGAPQHRAAAARLLADLGVPAAPERTLLTVGAQHALMIALGAIARPGDTIAADHLTYPGLKTAARLLHLRLKGLPADDDGGLSVEAFATAAAAGDIKALFCMPNLQNPTGATWDLERRRRVLAVAARHQVAIVEDDVYGFLIESPLPALARLAPAQVFHINGFAKSLAPALRIGALVLPPDALARIGPLGGSIWMAPPLMAEVIRLWVDDGTALRLVQDKRREGRHRQTAVRRRLDAAAIGYTPPAPNAFHLWIHLPEPWRDDEVVAAAARAGVTLNPAWSFAVGRAEHAAIRVCFSRPPDLDQVEVGMAKLVQILTGPGEFASIV